MSNKPAVGPLLSSYKVLDLTQEKGYYFLTKILGDLGAEVTRLEKPGLQKDYWWHAYNSQKKIVPFDIAKEKDKLLQLVKDADVLVESFAPGYLDGLGVGYAALKKANPKLIVTSLTPFGQTGPYKDLKADDLQIMAYSGYLYVTGDADRPPVRISFPQSHLVTAAEGAVGTIMALCQRGSTGEGQQVDVSAQECVHSLLMGGIRKQALEVSAGSTRRRIGGYHTPLPGFKLGGRVAKYQHMGTPLIWPCKEGHIAYLQHNGPRGAYTNRMLAQHMAAEIELPDIVRNMKWETFDAGDLAPEDLQLVWDTFAKYFMRHSARELYAIALKERLEYFPGNTVKEILDEQVAYKLA